MLRLYLKIQPLASSWVGRVGSGRIGSVFCLRCAGRVGNLAGRMG